MSKTTPICKFSLILFLLGIAVDPAARANTIVVNTTSDAIAGDGACSLPEAILAANLDQAQHECPAGFEADHIHFDLPAGSTLLLTAPLPVITESIAIRGPGAQELTIDGDGAHRIFVLESPGRNQWYLLAGMTLSGAGTEASGDGAAVSISPGETATLSELSFLANVAQGSGGAVSVSGMGVDLATATIDSCHFEGNSSLGPAGGGALYVVAGSTVTVRSSSFVGNGADHVNGVGGAISVSRAELVLERSTVSGNHAMNSGGGISAIGATAPVAISIQDSTIVHNTANLDGDNQGDGGGLYVDGGVAASQVYSLRNSILASNTDGGSVVHAPDLYLGSLVVENETGFNVIGSNSAVETEFPAGDPNPSGNFVGTDSAPILPLLQSLAFHGGPTPVHRPILNPATRVIDHGSCDGQRVDQRGSGDPVLQQRAVDHATIPNHQSSDGCDIGSVERGAGPSLDPVLFADGFELGHTLLWSSEAS